MYYLSQTIPAMEIETGHYLVRHVLVVKPHCRIGWCMQAGDYLVNSQQPSALSIIGHGGAAVSKEEAPVGG